MSSAVFPSLIGQFRRRRTPQFDTAVFEAVSGKEFRTSRRGNPASIFELSFDVLPYGTDLATLWGFFVARRGNFDSFLITAADDFSVTGQALGTGDGVTTTFQLVRSLGGTAETIQAPNAVTAVKRAGVDHADWTVSAWGSASPGVVTFSGAPPLGQAITADFTYYWPVRFNDPMVDFDRFFSQLYAVGSLKIKQLL